jgi:hypothetical protein
MVLFGVFTFVIGFRTLKSIRRMTRAGTAHVVFHWRLFGSIRQYSRHSNPALYSITIFQNAFLAAIMLSFTGGMLLMFVFSLVEMFAAK